MSPLLNLLGLSPPSFHRSARSFGLAVISALKFNVPSQSTSQNNKGRSLEQPFVQIS